MLVDWALVQGKLGLPPTHAQFCHIVQRILHTIGDHQPLGKHWIRNFLARNPSLKTVRSKPLVNTRVNGASPANTKHFFELLDQPAIQEIPP